jgi:hypothetical protein
MELVVPYQTSVPQADLSQAGSELHKTKSLLDQNVRSSATISGIEDLNDIRIAAWIV